MTNTHAEVSARQLQAPTARSFLTHSLARQSIPADAAAVYRQGLSEEGGMKLLVTGLTLLSAAIAANAQESHPTHTIIAADAVAWAAGPPSLQPGAEAAVLYGDPSKEGLFVMRLKLPAGFRIAPHTHPKPEILTVVSGAFHIGMGTVADEAKSRRLEAGSFFAFDPGLAHYAHVEEDTVVQLSSTGPWTISYIDPADDPRQ